MPSASMPLIDLEVRKLRNVFGDGIGGQPLALLVENHHGHAGDGLGHGEVAEDGVFRHGRAAGQVAHAVGAVVHHFAVARKDGDDAGDLLLIDGLLHEGVQALEALGGKADRLRLHDGEIDCMLRRLLRKRRSDRKSKHQARQCYAHNELRIY